MPKVRRSRKKPPEGWELIEPTLDELEQKMREGKLLFFKHFSSTRTSLITLLIIFQLKQSHMKANVSMNHCGRYSRFTIKSRDTFSIYLYAVKLFPENFMNIVSKRRQLTVISQRNGRNLAMKIFAACDVFKLETQILERIVFVEFQNQNQKKVEWWSVCIVDAEAVLDK